MNQSSIHKDDLLYGLIEQEMHRQQKTISLIASENYAPPSILSIMGTALSNKYAEGLPGKRFYAGCSVVDTIENMAIERCKALFNAEYAHVQAHSGSQANMAVYMATLNPGDTIMGMDMSSGGHLTHGFKANFSGKLYNIVHYGVNPETERIDYDMAWKQAEKYRPKLIIAGASAYTRIIDFAEFARIAQSVGALFLADIAHIAGLVATGLHQSPVGLADYITSTTHKTLRGPRGAFIMSKQQHAATLDRAVMPGVQGGPFMQVIAAKALCFSLARTPEFFEYQRQILANAKSMADTFIHLGYKLVSGGTDNHMLIIDLTPQGLTGLQAERLLERAGISTSRSCIPFDQKKPSIASGIRLGTAAMSSRGMKEAEAQEIAGFIHEIIINKDDTSTIAKIAQQVGLLCDKFPLDEQL